MRRWRGWSFCQAADVASEQWNLDMSIHSACLWAVTPTLSWPCGACFDSKGILLRAPFQDLLVALALDALLLTLCTRRLGLVAFQSLLFAVLATYAQV